MICKNCGVELPDGAAFCAQCGSAVEEPVAPAEEVPEVVQIAEEVLTAESASAVPAESVPVPKKKSRWKLIVGILAAIVAVAIVAVIAYIWLSASQPEPIIGHWTSYAATDGDSVGPYSGATMDIEKDGTYTSRLHEKSYTGQWKRYEKKDKTEDDGDRYYVLTGDLFPSILNYDEEKEEINLLLKSDNLSLMVVFQR